MDLVVCPVCKKQGSDILYKTETNHLNFYIIQCRQCSLAYTFPLPDDNILNVHDKPRYYGKNESKFLPIIQNIRDRLSRNRARQYLSMISNSIQKPRILDIGCAEGRLLNSFLKYGCECYGVEHQSYPKERFIKSDRIQYITGDLGFLDCKEDFFDIIILWHVLEHMDNPASAIKRIYDLLSPDGIFILAVPNFSSLEAKLFKQSWFHLDIPWHKYHFTKRFLKLLVEKNNFKIIESSTFCIEQNVYGLLQSILNFMGWPKNELYEAIKGNFSNKRSVPLIIQVIISISMLMPCFLISFLTSKKKSGSVIKLVLKKRV
jgi:2-polyprenyl-3-methyl-5-hydroxy-6-metoxy-1,4-benzoquinol methylase